MRYKGPPILATAVTDYRRAKIQIVFRPAPLKFAALVEEGHFERCAKASTAGFADRDWRYIKGQKYTCDKAESQNPFALVEASHLNAGGECRRIVTASEDKTASRSPPLRLTWPAGSRRRSRLEVTEQCRFPVGLSS
jgi:hypothetical protein